MSCRTPLAHVGPSGTKYMKVASDALTRVCVPYGDRNGHTVSGAPAFQKEPGVSDNAVQLRSFLRYRTV
jgi:hypothetical protein